MPKSLEAGRVARRSFEAAPPSIPAQFELQARLHPDRIAVEDESSALRYGQLNRLANRIARSVLAARGTGSEPVALLCRHGVPVIAAMLGVLKAGKFYVALDASQPMARLVQVATEARAALLITDGALLQQAEALRAALGQSGAPCALLSVDTLEPGLSEEDLDLAISASDLAYLVFTSGSTGTPKAVMQDHRYILHLTEVYTQSGQITAADRLSLLSSPSFAGAVRDIYCALLNGASLATFDVKRHGLSCLATWLRDRRISVCFAVATVFRNFCRLLGPEERFPALRLIELGSETVYAADVQLYQRHFSRACRLLVNLGGSEISPICQFPIDADTRIEGGSVPAGYAADAVELLLWDSEGRPVSAGAEGEIVVRSRYLSRGYWRRPELTAAVFLPDPEGGDQRLFRTGDLGRLLPDGCLLHLGRCDFQVKIRGYRVEPAEVEAFFTRTGLIRDAVVTAWRDAAGEQNLAAWLVPALPEAPPSPSELRALAAAALPEYMVPARLVLLDSLPVTASGKVDRGALPDPRLSSARPGTDQQAPRAGVERRLHEIWSDVLGRTRLGRDENFFDLGGNSLLAMRVVARIATRFRVTLPLNALFEAPTLAQLAFVVKRARRNAPDQTLLLVPRGVEAPAALTTAACEGRATAGQQDFWIASTLGLPSAGSQVMRVLTVVGAAPAMERWQAAWSRLIARHPALRTSFCSSADDTVVWRTQAVEELAPRMQLGLDRCDSLEAARQLIAARTCVPFVLDQAPLARAGLVQVTQGAEALPETLLWFSLHHAVVDGLSARIVQDELHALLSECTLPTAPNGVALASDGERSYLQSELAARDRSWWRDGLDALISRAGAEAFQPFATDRRRPAVPSGESVDPIVERLSADVVAALTRVIRAEHVGLHALLLTLLAAEVRRREGRDNVIIGSALSLRPPGAERAVGHFVNVVPLILRADCAASSLAEQMHAAQIALVDAIQHGSHPGGLLYREFRQRHPDARPHSRTSLFDISLTSQPSRSSGAAGAGFSLTPSHLPGEQAYPAAGIDLAFSHEPVADGAGGLELTLLWNPDVYRRETAQAWLRSFAAWARWLAEDVARAAAPLPALLDEEAAQLARWERGPRLARPAKRFHELFESLADSQPQRAAVVTDTSVQSYAQLEQQANRIAWALLQRGATSEEPIAVLTECSPDLPATVLGIWKAGAAYLPLALEQPPERLARMARDSAARFLIVLDGHEVPSALTRSVETILRPADWEADTGHTDRPVIAGTPQSLAYVIYTSGTTGIPKGVLLQHDGVVNVAYATGENIGLNADDRVSLVSTPGFDASLWELGLALLHGLPLVPAGRVLRDDPWALKRHYTRLGVTVAFHAASYLRVSEETPFEGLRILVTGAEPVTHEDARHHADRLAMWNGYGPTEACIITNLERLAFDRDASRAVSAGPPLSNTCVSIRRDSGVQVPPGAIGEVWLGGVGLARGYLNNPELTAQRFVETPVGRFYRSGDRGRWTDAGQLVLAGRIDGQIKLQGQRVELGEIEQALRSHPAVEDGVSLVALAENPRAANDSHVLCAFVRLRPGVTAPTQAEWRSHLGDHLPPYMIPAWVSVVATIPLTFAGKVDRDALRRYPREPSDERGQTPPKGELEVRIAALWADVLGASVSREDNFFGLGGNSLLAVTIAHRLSTALARPVPARELFVAPTLAGFAQRIAELPSGADYSGEALQRSDLATEGQREFWVAEAAGLDTRTFNMLLLRRVVGRAPALELLRSAWDCLVARHEALRSYFCEDAQGRLRSQVAPTLHAALEHATRPDLVSAKAFIRQRQSEPLVMSVPPLWRAGLVDVQETGEPLFWLVLHHAVGDGQSLAIIARELCALLRGEQLAELTLEFAHSAGQEQAYLSGAACVADALYWRELFSRLPAAAFDDVLTDSPRALGAKAGNHRFETRLDVAASAGLQALARQHGTTLHAVVLTLLSLEAQRRTGRADIVIGTTASTRETAAEAQVLGYYVNMVPVPCHLPRSVAFGVALQATLGSLSSALQHARYPFARMYREFWSEHPQQRHPARYPLFDLAITENPESVAGAAGVRLLRVPAADGGETDAIAYELTDVSPGQDMVLAHERLADGGLLLQWHVNAALYTEQTARRWFEALRDRAVWLAEDRTRTREAWPALLPREAAWLKCREQGATVPRPALRFHELFERVLDTPDGQAVSLRPAIVTHTNTTTYLELEQQANAIAHALLLRGVVAGSVVGVLTGRSPHLPAALLGIWKAGAIYLPLCAELPPERLHFMARDAEMASLLVLDGLDVPSAFGRQWPTVLRPHDIDEDFRRSHAHRPPAAGGGSDADAYILYTSGSTGMPKGTLVGHVAYVNCVLGTGEALGLTRDDRSLLFSSPSFDVSLMDMGLPLAFGAAVCPVPYEILSSPSRFRDYLTELNITVADITPTYLRLLDGQSLPSLRVLVTGGEPPLAADVRTYAARHCYFNAYGPTENTITSTLGQLRPHDQSNFACGRPLPNTHVEVCDHEARPVPPGVIGELWLGGIGLARGYVGRQVLTAAAFVETARGRRYRSGDLGRWRDNGELEVLGRSDDQVKLSGIRIELGEIEHAIAGYPGVAQAVAVLDRRGGGNASLWAFARLRPGEQAPTDERWRDYLAERLPSYMIPSAVIAIDDIPVTMAGKVDKAALAARLAEHAPRSEVEPPAAGLEADIARVWSELLGDGRLAIQRDDNFFALGGHSLLAIAVAHSLEKTLGHPVPARELFAAPSLRGFAQRVAQLSANGVATAAPELASDRATEGQREFWIAEQAGLDNRNFNLALTLRVRGPVPALAEWCLAWADLVARHGALRTGFHNDAAGVLRRSELPRLGAELETSTQPDMVRALAHVRERQTQAFSLENPPLWRAGLAYVTGEECPLFWLALHHAVGDGLSLGILTEELSARLRGERLAPVASTYDAVAGREERYLAGPSCRDDAAYWQKILRELGDGSPETPQPFDEWPLDFPRSLEQSRSAANGCHTFSVRLASATASGLRAFAQRQGASLHALMLTIMAHEARRRTGRPALVLGTAASTRASVGEAQLVGYCINLLPIACRTHAEESVELALQAMQQSLASGLQHARYPFASIVRDFRRDHAAPQHPARRPLFDLVVTQDPAIQAGERQDDHALALYSVGAAAWTDESTRYVLRPAAPSHDMVLVHADQANGSLIFHWHVNAALYEKETAEAWIDSLAGWARFLADAERTAGSAWPGLLPQEQAKLAVWQCGPILPHPAASFPAHFERWARLQPERPALITDHGVQSYALVSARTNALAHALRARGVTRHTPVGVLTERSIALPEIVLAIWKAGGCYVPLLQDLPADRLAFIARDAGIQLLVVLDGHEISVALAAACGGGVFRPESLSDAFFAGHGQPLEPVGPEHAYIMYTSGSTGVPKGVLLRHEGLNNLGVGLRAALDLRSDDRVLLLASPVFDSWIAELLSAWATGAALVPVVADELNDPPGLRDKLARLGVSVATLTPSYLRLFEQAEFPSLRVLITAGESPGRADALHYAARLRYINGYGPTENTVAVSFGRVAPDAQRLTVGKPLANTSVHIRNRAGEWLPPGAVGLVWVGGMGLACGYLNRPELTAASFVETTVGRLYCTGDVGRWTQSGEIQILGRGDEQVKLHGQRIELGEIEHSFAAHPSVAQAVAVLEARPDGGQILWAFVCLRRGAAEPSQAQWQDHLGRTLPRYMLPSAVISVAAIPLSSSGKADRAALLRTAGEPNASVVGEEGRLLCDDTERRIAGVWSEVLACGSLGRDADFFACGGNSLQVIAVVNRLRRTFQCTIKDLYEHPRLADFARTCRPQPEHLRTVIRAAAQHWQSYQSRLASYDAERDAALSAALRSYELRNQAYLRRAAAGSRDYTRVLLTGSTGYLGSYLLRELLADSQRQVSVLVRGRDDAAARARLGESLCHYFGAQGGAELRDSPRLTVLAGDLRRDDLGLTRDAHERLADGLQAVFHAAANVKHFGHYWEFHADNVAATGRLLQLAARGANPADFHLVSTLSSCGAAPEAGFRLFTEYDSVPELLDENYYIRSKQEAERLVVAARQYLANACIHRVGNLVFAADGGPLQLDIRSNAFFRQLAAFMSLGVVPDDAHVWLCHVDTVARGLVLLAGSAELTHETHHLEHARRDTLASCLTADDGARACSFDVFLQRLNAAVDEPELDAALTHTLENLRLYDGMSPQSRNRRLEIVSDRSQLLLTQLGLTWPNVPASAQAAMLREARRFSRTL